MTLLSAPATICAVIIDFHTHIFSPRINQNRDAYLGRDPVFNVLYANPKARLASAEDIVQSMDDAGVDAAGASAFEQPTRKPTNPATTTRDAIAFFTV